LIFALETSCDETSTSIISPEGKILSHIIVKQSDHEKFGGVVPEIASRSHIQILQKIIPQTLFEAGMEISSINAFCSTCGPGLIGGLLVGSTVAKTMAIANNKPFYPINHLEGHALSVQINKKIDFPFLLLLITGGHTQIYYVHKIGSYKLLGTTIDDSVGETFDKVAKMLGMKYPGGPEIEKRAIQGNEKKIQFPKPLIKNNDFNFSFSGLKTAVRLKIIKEKNKNNSFTNDVCASFQNTVIEILLRKTEMAIEYVNENFPKINNLVVAGGVAANMQINKSFISLCKKHSLKLAMPPKELCGDNAAMIGWACLQRFNLGYKGDINFKPRPRWGLEELNDEILVNKI
tara:strand:- start:18917 stop:19957 length:1041 start_codon:yes stop_codon:yes gene_type:complete